MSFRFCVCVALTCMSSLRSARVDTMRLQMELMSTYELGWYQLDTDIPVIETAYSSKEVGHLAKGQRVEVLEVLEVRASRVVWGRINKPVQGFFAIADKTQQIQFAQHVDPTGESDCEQFVAQSKHFCKLSVDAIKWHFVDNKLKGEKPVGIARLSLKKDNVCYIQYFRGASTEAEAQQKVLKCCEEARRTAAPWNMAGVNVHKTNPANCKLVGPAMSDGFEKKCNFHLGKKTWWKDKCYCPEERPHVLRSGSSITWHTPGETELYINVEDQVVCVDDCTARSLGPSPATDKTNLNKDAWPVVFLAVYTLGFGIVHSNLAFCPDASIVKNKHACLQPGATGSCSESHHTTAFAKGNDVPRLLMDHGCRELIFDGNEGGGLWTPSERETGCWAQGLGAQEFWWGSGDGGNYRSGVGYQKLFWLSSDNSVRPFAEQLSWFTHGALDRSSNEQSAIGKTSLEMRMKKCFSDKLGTRIDFNPGTYSLLHHNCNKFSSEAMRELNLPLFAKAANKGYHGEIALSATPEESVLRRGFHKVVSYFDPSRSQVSTTCRAQFFEAVPNCRRIGWGGRKGDCPVDYYDEDALRCYDPNMRSSEPTSGLSTAVEYNERVNGVCGIPAGKSCLLHQDFTFAPCQPGFHCANQEVTVQVKVKSADGKKDILENRTETKPLCTMDDVCAKAVTGATMRESDNPVAGAWCKCPKGTKVLCDPPILERRLFNPAEMKGTCSCAKAS